MELIIALIGTATAVVTLAITNYYSKRNQLKFDERKLKEEYYLAYIKAISKNVISENTNEARDELCDAQNKLLLVGSPNVVERLMIFYDYIKPSAKEDFTQERHDDLLGELVKTMRADLFKSNKINKGYPVIHLTGRPREKQ